MLKAFETKHLWQGSNPPRIVINTMYGRTKNDVKQWFLVHKLHLRSIKEITPPNDKWFHVVDANGEDTYYRAKDYSLDELSKMYG